MVIEVCANSFTSAKNAQDAGADRIELCTKLSVGGLTPSYALVEKVITELRIPVHVLIRPRRGDFRYSETEINTMIKDISFCKKTGCAGIVSGVLNSENEIDESATKKLIEASHGMEFTFHRAFDHCNDPLPALDSLKKLSVTRLLSSGMKPKAKDGIPLLNLLKTASEETIQIMPGGGINAENVLIFKKSGFDMIHFSATKKQPGQGVGNDLIERVILGDSDPKEIEKIIKLLH